MTEEEKTLLINEIVDYLISHSQSVEGIPIQANLDGVSSFPAIKEVLNEESQVVRVSLDSILPEFRYYNGYVQYRFSSGNWINLFQVSTSLDGYATKDYVDLKVSEVISNAPVTLNTLNKIAAALNYDPSFYQNIYQAINAKWTTNPVKISNWDQAFMDRHVHDNISSLNLITDILVGKWNEAYSWGDHSVAGYEHELGNPLSNGQILSSNTDGTRSWVDQYIHPQSTVVPGIYTKVTVDLNGHVTYGNGLSQTDIPSISWNQVPFDRPTTLLGYGITDAYTKNYIDKYLQRKYSGVVDISEILLNENTVTVPASKVNLYSNSKFEGYVSEYEIAEKTFTITGIDVKYIVVSYNNGSPEYIITQERSMINYSNVIPIITLIYDGVKIHSVNWDEQANGLSERLLKRLNRTQRFQRDGGLLINVDGSRTITISQSTIYFGASEVVYPSSSSSTNLIYQYHHSDGVWTYTRSQFLNNLEYDNGTNLVSLSNDNRYTINWVYAGVGDDGDIITVLGSDDYKLDEAINAQPPSILPDIIRFHGILVGKVIYQKGLNTPYQVISISEQSISSGGTVVEHNNLNGLQGGNLEEFYHLSHSEYLNAQDSLSFSSTPGTYRSVTIDSKGRIVSGTNPTTLSEYGISDEDVTNSLLTGYALGQNAEVSSTDSIIGSIGKLQAYINARQGTVTSVGVSVPLGFTVLNSPITTNGIIGIGYTEGYSLPSNSTQSNWSSAYNYSLIGHLPLTGGNLSGNLGITGDLNISGNIYQSGSIYETHAENIYSKNDYIYMRDGSSTGLLDGYYSGLEFVKYDGVNNGRLVIDSYGVARVGDIGDEQPLTTREETPLSNGYAYWDELNKRFGTKLIPFFEIVNKPTTLTGYGITDGQPLDADLSAIANLSDTSGLLRKTSINTWVLDTNIYLTAITKAQVESVLTGDIATHTHSQYLTGNQTITVSGDATGSGTTSIALTLANSGVISGTYNDSATQVRPFTVDSKGRITSISAAVLIQPDWGSITGRPTTLGGYGITDAYTKTDVNNTFLKLSGGQLTGQLSLLQGNGGGISFPDDSFGGSGDSASIKLLNPAGSESTEMTFTMANDVDDIINFSVPSIDGVKVNRYTVWNAGNFTNLNQLTTRNFSDLQNKPTTIDGYQITDGVKNNGGLWNISIKGRDNTVSNALLQSGSGRNDDESGSTWLFWDTGGGPSAPWGIKHNQASNYIEYYGNGLIKTYIDLNNGYIYTNGKANTGDQDLSNLSTYTYVDNTFLKKSGGTMTGAIDFSGTQRNITGVNRFFVTDWTDFQLSAGTNFKIMDISTTKYLFKVTAGSTTVEMPDATALKISNNTVWHSGNDGAGSGLDAGLLCGRSAELYFKTRVGYVANINDASTLVDNSTCYWTPETAGIPNGGHGVLMSVSDNIGWYNQLGFGTNTRIYFRQSINSTTNFGNWNTLAFTTDNVASATKLQTARTIWGQNFDGTGNVSGNLGMGDATISGTAGKIFFGGNFHIDSIGGKSLYLNYYNGTDVFINTGSNQGNTIFGGNVGIGAFDSNYKLYVAGKLRAAGTVYTDVGIRSRNICIETDNNGNASTAGAEINNFNTILYLQHSTSNGLAMCAGGGNVSIGTSAVGSYRLYVNGAIGTNQHIRAGSYISAGEAADDAYGWINVTRAASIENASYFSMVRQGQYPAGFGITTDNSIIIGSAANNRTISDTYLKLNSQQVTTTKPFSSSNRIFTGYDSGQANSISCSNWFRSNGNSGWYNATYDGGITMTDYTYVRVHNNKAFKVTSTASDSINTDGGVLAGGPITTDSSFINTSYPGNALLLAGGGAMAQSALPFKAGALINAGTIYLTNPSPSASTGLVINSFAISPHESQDGIDYDITFNINSGYSNFDETALKDGKYVISITSLATGSSSYMPAVPNISYINTNSFTVTAYYNGPYIVNILYRV